MTGASRNGLLKKFGIIAILSLVFAIINLILIAKEWYFLSLVPFALLIVYLSIIELDKLIYLVVFFVPVSIPLEMLAPQLGFNLQLPTEPILAWILVLFFFRLLYERRFDKGILLHPVSLAIYFNLFWIFITSITSSMPVVSLKFLVARLWFLAAFYFIATQIFTSKKGIRTYVWMFIPMLLVVIAYALVKMVNAGLFNQQAAHLAASPFFNDHTSYGCILAMIIPFVVGFLFIRKYSTPMRMLIWIILLVLLFAFLLSYTRAAWLSIVVAGGVLLLILFQIKFRWIIALIITALAIYLPNREALSLYLEKNRQNSSKDLMEHVKSISNIRTDDSNVERLNRWKSAFRMFKERPFFGWGPGTYQFQYAPFQMSHDKTSISTNAGDRGNAHSEYIGSLTESGIFGGLSFALLGVVTLITGIRLYRKAKGLRQVQILATAATLGLVTYYVHGALNNFLDTDKASVLFWGFTAMIVALDVYHTENQTQ